MTRTSYPRNQELEETVESETSDKKRTAWLHEGERGLWIVQVTDHHAGARTVMTHTYGGWEAGWRGFNGALYAFKEQSG
jgi:hypothetical protein